MKLKESVELLEKAAGELAAFIAMYNLNLRKQVNSQTETEPDYMDMQTCHELQALANCITTPEQAIAHFGGYLIDNCEDQFEGGEDQIQQLSIRVLESFNELNKG